MRKNKRLIMAMAVVLAVATLAGGSTFAWFVAQDQALNHMETGQFSNGDVKIVEVFNEDDPFDPGVEINKDVWAVNISSIDSLVRISYTEALLLLGNDGDPSVANPNQVWTSSDTAHFPQLFTEKALAAGGVYENWKDLKTDTAAATAFSNIADVRAAIPAGVTVLYKEFDVTGTAAPRKEYHFVAYAPISAPGTEFDGKYQRVSIATSKYTSADKTLELSGYDFWVFTYGLVADTIKTKWADLNVFADNADYTKTALAPVPSIAVGADREDRFVSATSDALIQLIFSEYVSTDLAAITAMTATSHPDLFGKMWWLNTADGYLYYINKVEPGKSTSEVLDAVTLLGDADNKYGRLNFDLTVRMEAIQNVKEALSSGTGGGWGLTNADLLIAALVKHNPDAFTQSY